MRVSALGIRNFFHSRIRARIRVALFLGLALRDPLFAFTAGCRFMKYLPLSINSRRDKALPSPYYTSSTWDRLYFLGVSANGNPLPVTFSSDTRLW